MPEESPQPPERREAWNDQLAGIVVKSLIGGGVGTFIAFLNTTDLPKLALGAGLGGAATGVATIVSSFVDPIAKKTRERLGKAGEATAKTLDDGAENTLAKLTRFDDRYLQRQAWACETDRPDIPRDVVTSDASHKTIAALLLEQVYVPLRLDARSMRPGFNTGSGNLPANQELCDRLDIWEILANVRRDRGFRQLAILAWGGYGKTTLLKHIAHTYGTKRQPSNAPNLVPILLIFRKYRDLLASDTPPSLPDLITQHHLPSLPDGESLTPPIDWAKNLLRQGKALVMLDGFDEIPRAQRPAVAGWLNMQLEQYRQSVFILTSRPKAYTEQEPEDRLELATTFWVQDFDKADRQKFVRQWYECQEYYASGRRDTAEVKQRAREAADELLSQIEAEPQQDLRKLAKNPLLLNMITSFHWRFPGAELPNRRVELYREICRLQLRDRPAARKLQTLLTHCDAQPILQQLALEMMQQRQERRDRADLLAQLATYLTQAREKVTAAEFLEQVEQVSELLVRQENDYEFAHLSFQEYLAATQIAQQKQESLLYDHFDDGWWKPTILLYAAQTNPTSLIQTALSRGAIDLAYTCLQETTKLIDPALEQQIRALKRTVQITRYAQLEEHLKAQQWIEADRETYRLMITAVGKEEGQIFTSEELLNFPCEELRAIDGLWVKHSNGRFGFSVQKQIYVECGARLDGKYPSAEVWETFGERVCWRKDGDWLNYNDLNPSLSSPKGIFPRMWAWRRGLWRVLVSSLAQRLVNCSTSQS